MQIGRLLVSFSMDDWKSWHIFPLSFCGCKILFLGPLEITWFARDCKCARCYQHSCICPPEK